MNNEKKDYTRHYYAPVVKIEYENTIFDDYARHIKGRGFLATTSDREQYEFLKVMDKQTGDNKALLFLEDLFSYGLERKHITNDPLIRTLMIPICDRIDSEYINYCKTHGYKADYIKKYEDQCDMVARVHAEQAERDMARRKEEEAELRQMGLLEVTNMGTASLMDLL